MKGFGNFFIEEFCWDKIYSSERIFSIFPSRDNQKFIDSSELQDIIKFNVIDMDIVPVSNSVTAIEKMITIHYLLVINMVH